MTTGVRTIDAGVRVRIWRSDREFLPPQKPQPNGQPSWAIKLVARCPSIE